MNRAIIAAAGIAATLAFGALWHGPLGAGEALAGRAEALASATLERYEMTAIAARFERDPLARTLTLSGPADSFQRAELVRILSEVPGVARVRWDAGSLPQEGARS